MITARDLALPHGVPAMASPGAMAAHRFAPARAPAVAAPFRERFLLVVLYITVLGSSVAFIEPSPHDALMGVLVLVTLIAGVKVDRKITTLFMLLLIFNVGGLLSLLNVPGQEVTIQFAATSVYLAVAAVLWALLLSDNTMPRLAVLRAAYTLSALAASVLGMIGYFRLFPGAYDLFTMAGRARGLFKDPNVYAPFLIWPVLVVLLRMLTDRIRLADVAVAGTIMVALLLAFSRGAWFHLTLSALVMLALAFLTAPTPAKRMRIFTLSAIAIALLAVLVVILLSLPAIATMFKERAQLIQSYDVGSGGRFRLQEQALTAVLQFPNGMGPFGFASTHANQQHNVYLQAFLVYGWAGAMAYIVMLVSTLILGLRSALVPTPWQPYLIAAYGTFVGEVAEGFVIDTDHWRHFFLLLGMIWGLSAATSRHLRARHAQAHWAPAVAT